MRNPVEQPVTVADGMYPGDKRTKTTHPAFAQIGASRVSGRTNLYGSDFDHNAFMTITIRRSELNRNLANDWHFGNEQLIEVHLSESQWATFVSSPNVGSGVPCTLYHFNGQMVPGLPDPEPRAKQFSQEVREAAQDSLNQLDELMAEIDKMGLSGKKADHLKGYAKTARARLTGSIPFIAEQFDEHAEKTVEKAKSEIHGYMNGVLTRSGLQALQGQPMPLQLEGRQAEDGE